MSRALGIILIVILLLAGAFGIAEVAFQAGVAQGLATQPGGSPTVVMPYGYPHFGFGFGLFGLLFPLLFLLLIFGLARFAFWRGGGPRHWEERARMWEERARTVHDEWHRAPQGGAREPTATPTERA